jgi:hypothetical protein
VVEQVVAAEGDPPGEDDGEVGHQGGQRVHPGCLDDQVVGGLVDEHPEGVVGHRPHEPRGEQHHPEALVAQHPGEPDLEGDHADQDGRRPGLRPLQELRLGVGGEQAARPLPVRFRVVHPDEVELGGHAVDLPGVVSGCSTKKTAPAPRRREGGLKRVPRSG